MNLGFGELLLIFIVVMLVFGSSKLPALGDALGRGIKNFKRTMDEPDSIDVTPKTATPAEAPRAVADARASTTVTPPPVGAARK
jgi:sec-independent protein translocase protein TatA